MEQRRIAAGLILKSTLAGSGRQADSGDALLPQPPLTIREANPGDASALLEIYRPYVEQTAVSFELSVPAVEEFAARVEKSQGCWSWLLAEQGGEIVGYAYGGAHRAREAYARSVETSAYVAAAHHRKGIARALYEELFRELRALGYQSAYAGITLPNEASVGLHRSLGFEPIGVFPRVGYKFGEWHDVAWLYRPVEVAGAKDRTRCNQGRPSP